MVEYVPSDEKKLLQIYIESQYLFRLWAYSGLSKEKYYYYVNRIYFNTPLYEIKLEDPLESIDLESGEKYYVALDLLSERSRKKISVKYIGNPIDELYEIKEKIIQMMLSQI